jgi:hypothetical protein
VTQSMSAGPRELPTSSDIEARLHDEEDLRATNQAADWEVMGWPEIRLRGKTRRRWPTSDGWWALGIPSFIILATAASTIYAVLTPTGVNPYWAQYYLIEAVALGVAVVLVLLYPPWHQRVTARWQLTVSPALIRLDIELPSGDRVSKEIRRVDAGEIEIESRDGLRNSKFLHSATGTSVNGLTTIQLRNDSVAGPGFVGHFLRIPIAAVMVSWWPINGQSFGGLLDFYRLGLPYWCPDGVPPRPRPDLFAGS